MKTILNHLLVENVVFICIGTDRSTGDALGPLVGTGLEKLGYTNVIGTMDNLCHAVNIHERLKEIPEGKTVIAIDAGLGKLTSVGNINYFKGPIKPGSGVNKDLGLVGDYGIMGIVNVGGFMEYFVMQNTPLNRVMKMAKEIVDDISEVLLLHQLQIAASFETFGDYDGI